VRIGVAVHEAVVNAMVHGNLEVGSEAKAGNWDEYHATIARRRVEEPYRSRRVAITVRATRAPFLEVRVADDGRGFDPATVPDPTNPAHLGDSSGRGLLLIRTFFDRVAHSPSGNEIVMQKGADGVGGAGTAGSGG
jgi:anti-sigma regulatory factor (Ser/Thr protein kinase)